MVTAQRGLLQRINLTVIVFEQIMRSCIVKLPEESRLPSLARGSLARVPEDRCVGIPNKHFTRCRPSVIKICTIKILSLYYDIVWSKVSGKNV